jgi:prepilin-type N-terminal cleavage/methylation domain-containing protein
MFRRAFTLVELLVVIAIIGLLSTVAVVATSSARSKANDAKWMADKNQVIKALQLYYNVNNAWPSSGGTFICMGSPTSQSCWRGAYLGLDSFITAMSSYMTAFPVINADSGAYAYNRILYHSNYSMGGYTGPFIVWPKENTMTAAECQFVYHYDKYYYCYEYLGNSL